MKILREVLGLSKEKQDELASVLDRTSLSSIINAAKEITDRLEFLSFLEQLLFHRDNRERLRERNQLDAIIEREMWIFGEEYRLTTAHKSVEEVVRKHVGLNRQRNGETGQLRGLDGEQLIPDLMLSRAVRLPRADQYEHLVVELKRPNVQIDDDVVTQLRRYAFAIAGDERVKDNRTKWTFIAVSNEMSKLVERQAGQRNAPFGRIHDDEELQLTIWVTTWSRIINDCRSRLRYFQDKLEYEAGQDGAMDSLKVAYAKYIPD